MEILRNVYVNYYAIIAKESSDDQIRLIVAKSGREIRNHSFYVSTDDYQEIKESDVPDFDLISKLASYILEDQYKDDTDCLMNYLGL